MSGQDLSIKGVSYFCPSILKKTYTYYYYILLYMYYSQVSGQGLSIKASFTRSPHLYCPSMAAVQLAFRNEGGEAFGSIRMEECDNMHAFSPVWWVILFVFFPCLVGFLIVRFLFYLTFMLSPLCGVIFFSFPKEC